MLLPIYITPYPAVSQVLSLKNMLVFQDKMAINKDTIDDIHFTEYYTYCINISQFLSRLYGNGFEPFLLHFSFTFTKLLLLFGLFLVIYPKCPC